MAQTKTQNLIDGATASVAAAVAAIVDISRATAITLQFTRADHTSGSSAFTVEVSNDGVNWVAYNKLIKNVTNTNSQTLLREAGPTLSSNTSLMYSFSPEDCYVKMRVTVVETTDGTHTCTAHIRE
jgi:hypothetical protein